MKSNSVAQHVEYHVHIHISVEVLLTYRISKWKATTTTIFALSGSNINDKEIPTFYVGAKLQEVFKLDSIVPFGKMIVDSHKSKANNSLRNVIF
jgi:hypothetical protein